MKENLAKSRLTESLFSAQHPDFRDDACASSRFDVGLCLNCAPKLTKHKKPVFLIRRLAEKDLAYSYLVARIRNPSLFLPYS